MHPLPTRVRPIEVLRRYAYFARYYLGSLVGRKRPILAGVKITHQCNLKCIHCPFHLRDNVSLSFDQAVSSLRTLHEWGVRLAIIEGGEPFMWRDGEHTLADVVAEAKDLFYCVGVTTNGTLPLDVDADVVWVSIDGLKETHDRIRGMSFDRIMQNIAASSHPKIYAHLTINTLNASEVPDLIELLASKVKAITIQFHYPYEELADDLFLPFDRRREVLDQVIALKKQGLPLANSYACLEAMKDNRWTCRPWMIASVDPDGSMRHGCYVKDRGEISCAKCGFSAHTEISLAYAWSPGAILVGEKIFHRY